MFKCPFCGRSLGTFSSLRQHVTRDHTSVVDGTVCPACGARTLTNRAMILHYYMHAAKLLDGCRDLDTISHAVLYILCKRRLSKGNSKRVKIELLDLMTPEWMWESAIAQKIQL